MSEEESVFCANDYFNIAYTKIKQTLTFKAKNKRQFQTWKKRFRKKLIELLDPYRLYTDSNKFLRRECPLEPRILERVEAGGVIREKVVFNSEPDAKVSAYLIIPENVKFPARAVVALHGHVPKNMGKRALAGVYANEEEKKWTEPTGHDYGLQMAKHGFVTIVPDARGWGERRKGWDDFPGRDGCNVEFLKALLMGMNCLTLNLWDDMTAIDYLCTRPEVDKSRIGCLGLSLGGTRSMYLAALDGRIKVAMISGYLNTFKTYAIKMANTCGSQTPPGLLRYAEMADVAGLICPKPLLIESGVKDEGFSIKDADESYAHLKRIYEVAGVPEKLDRDRFDGGHIFSGAKTFDWFNKWL